MKFDNSHNIIEPTLVLATRSGAKLGVIPAVHISASDNLNSSFELEFEVNKTENGTPWALWDKLTDFKLVWCREWDVWFEIYVTTLDENSVSKSVRCVSLGEAELSEINLYDIEINTEDDISRDDYVPTVLYDEENKNGSLLHRIMEKAPHYTVAHVDSGIAKLQRTFSFNGKTLRDAFNEISEENDCLFVYNSGTDDNGKIERSISVYDLESRCLECGYRGEFEKKCPKCESENILSGYGKDTSVFVSSDNLAESVSFETDTDSVKNCFRLEGGDELMTAAIMSLNPNGSRYLWYISDEVKSDMSDELAEKLNAYDSQYSYYENEHQITLPSELISGYNALIKKYSEYDESLRTLPENITGFSSLMNTYFDTIDFCLLLHDELMPSTETSKTTAKTESEKLTAATLSPVSVQNLNSVSLATANSAVLAMAKVLISPNYQISVKTSSYESRVWTGNFAVTSYSDETDTYVSETVCVTVNEDYEAFTKQKIDKALKKSEDTGTSGIVSLFGLSDDLFKTEIKKYCLSSLNAFADSAQSCIDILIEQGISDKKTWADKDPNLYESLYLDYYKKLLSLHEEQKLRENEIAVINSIQTAVENERNLIQKSLDMQTYLGEDLWKELSSYRREDTYSNDNYISDGLNNSELFERASQFLETAKKEIYKSATLQHSITASLHNLLVMKEFEPIVDDFSVGNRIRVKSDEGVYRLRLLSYSVDFDNLDSLTVEFSDVKQCKDSISDTESVLNQASSMATSYDTVSRQAGSGSKAREQLKGWVSDGLNLTNMKIVDSADNQNITIDSHGILGREYRPVTDDYSDKQIKVINKGIYVTDDNWLTSKAGVGEFTFYNPENGEIENAYGVIADKLVGNLVLSEKIGVYNTNNTLTMDENGLVVTTDGTNDSSDDIAFTVQKKIVDADGNESLVPLLYIDENGNLVINGTLGINTSGEIQNLVDSGVDTVREDLNNYKSEVGKYLVFDENGLSIGASGSKFKAVLDNKRLSFNQGDVTAAYIDNEQLHIPKGVIEDSLSIGNFSFVPHSSGDGGVSLVWNDN